MKPLKVLLSLGFFFIIIGINAQDTYSLEETSKATIKGTSSLHDWESVVSTIKGEAQISGNKVQRLTLAFATKSIISDHKKMDKITWETLKEEDYPEITFKQTAFETTNGKEVISHGNLTIAGVTRKVSIKGISTIKEDILTIEAQHDLKFSDFELEPPKALFGTIKVGNELQLVFNLTLNKSELEN